MSSSQNENVEWAKDKFNQYSQIVIDSFNHHPKKNKMSCGEHFFIAMKSALISFGAGLTFTIHALFPMVLETTGSDLIACLNNDFEDRKCELNIIDRELEDEPIEN